MILIALGSNLSRAADLPPAENVRGAVEKLKQISGLRFMAGSRWYVSAPIPASIAPDFVNGIVRLEGSAEPAWLLDQLHAIEHAAGRERREPNAPRVLDLDLIDLNGLIAAGPGPILPHPRAAMRAFVLRPIIDVAPEWVHPVLGETAANLLGRLEPQRIEVLVG